MKLTLCYFWRFEGKKEVEININWYYKDKIDGLNLLKISEANSLSSPSKFPQFGKIKNEEFLGEIPSNPSLKKTSK